MQKSFFTSPERLSMISWKSIALLRTFMIRFGSIKPRKYTGTTVKQQKLVRQAIIRARELWLLPYIK
jgi:small subunit ribosomal protein S18